MTRQSLQLLLLFVLFISTPELFAQAKYEGFGSGTPGGKGKRIVHVTNLNSKGPGSLHEAIGSNRTIVFDVGGTINDFRWDASDDNVVISYLTIDGSTAPPPALPSTTIIMVMDYHFRMVVITLLSAISG
ncbi:MAG: hypothetical protein WDO71_29055 [Bacteroidota bacterium]